MFRSAADCAGADGEGADAAAHLDDATIHNAVFEDTVFFAAISSRFDAQDSAFVDSLRIRLPGP